MRSLIDQHPWVLLVAFIALLIFIYALARPLMDHRQPGEHARVSLFWFLRFEVRGDDAPPNRGYVTWGT